MYYEPSVFEPFSRYVNSTNDHEKITVPQMQYAEQASQPRYTYAKTEKHIQKTVRFEDNGLLTATREDWTSERLTYWVWHLRQQETSSYKGETDATST